MATGNRYLDNLYERYRACVEIDGAAAHPEDEQWRDKSRDRWNAVHEGVDTIRIGVPDLVNQERMCRTAADVAKWLSGRGPRVRPPVRAGLPGSVIGGTSGPKFWVLKHTQMEFAGMSGYGRRFEA